jgi:hypothetical protein
MKKLKTIGIIVVAIMLFINHIKAQLPSSDPAFQLVWADSFNTAGYRIDTTKWSQKFGWTQADSVDSAWVQSKGKNIVQAIAYNKWYKPVSSPPIVPSTNPPDTTNCQVLSDTLNLYSRKETYSGDCWTWPSCPATPNPCNAGGCGGSPPSCWHSQYKQFGWTSAMLISKYKFRYGYFEMKFKLPGAAPRRQHYVTGPNFWLFNVGVLDSVVGKTSTINWSEIDIFEMIAHNNYYTTSLHYTHYPDSTLSYAKYTQADTIGAITGNVWHTAGCLWTSNEIVKYLDGVPVATLTNMNIKPDSLLPMPIILGVSNSPDSNDSLSDLTAAFPYQFKVKYVKVWQMKSACNTAITYCGTAINPATYISHDSLYQSVTIGGTNCVNQPITNTNYISIYGSNYVQLGAGFSVDNNSNVLIDVRDCIPSSGSKTRNQSQSPQPPPPAFLYKQSGHYTQ